MQQIVFKGKFSVLFDATKTENIQYLVIEIDCYLKHPEKKIFENLSFEKSRSIFKKIVQGVLTPYLGYLQTKFGINRLSRSGVSLHTNRQIHR